jgi:CheY-like chemotaxis protein
MKVDGMDSPLHVLVVDDNAMNRALAVFVLELDGFTVDEATNHREFEQSIALRRPDVIVMDVQLPGIDGLELTRRLKADPATASIAVIAVTAYSMKGDEQRMREAGCDDYVAKPLDVATFGQRVRSVLRGDH